MLFMKSIIDFVPKINALLQPYFTRRWLADRNLFKLRNLNLVKKLKRLAFTCVFVFGYKTWLNPRRVQKIKLDQTTTFI